MTRYALMLTILVALIAGPAKSHNPPTTKAKGDTALERKHHRLHELKGHAWAMVKHPRSYRELVWHRKALRRINRALAQTHFDLRYQSSPIWAIHAVFGRYGDQAVRVARCETGGTFDVSARNGQYLGLFQMGTYARGRYGHSGTALGQARAAYRYFVDSGRDWSPWSCKP